MILLYYLILHIQIYTGAPEVELAHLSPGASLPSLPIMARIFRIVFYDILPWLCLHVVGFFVWRHVIGLKKEVVSHACPTCGNSQRQR